MTTKYVCDKCNQLMTFDDDKYVVMNVGAGRQDGTFEQNKMNDLCPKCYREVDDFINGAGPEINDVETATDYLKESGYVVYKPEKRTRRIK